MTPLLPVRTLSLKKTTVITDPKTKMSNKIQYTNRANKFATPFGVRGGKNSNE